MLIWCRVEVMHLEEKTLLDGGLARREEGHERQRHERRRRHQHRRLGCRV